MLIPKPNPNHHSSPIAPRLVSNPFGSPPEPSRLRLSEDDVPQSQPGDFHPGDLVIIAKETDDLTSRGRIHDIPIYRVIRTYRGSISFGLYYELENIQTNKVPVGVYEKERLGLVQGQEQEDWHAKTLIGVRDGDDSGLVFGDDEMLRGD